jgi:hypothetical protein
MNNRFSVSQRSAFANTNVFFTLPRSVKRCASRDVFGPR